MPLVAAAVIGAGATAYAASQSNKAAKSAANAQQQATDQSLALQQQQFGQIQANNQPYLQAGNGALDALLAQYGLSGPAPQPQSDWDRYLRENEDVLHWAQASKQAGDPRSMEELAQLHYDTFGKNEGRLLENQSPYGQQPTFTRPEFGQAAPTMGSYGSRPMADSYFKDFQNSPGYQNILNEALRAVNAGSATAGKFYSGNRAIALQNRAAGLADQDYGDWWNRQNTLYQTDLSQYNMDRGFAQQNYNTALQQYNVNRNVLNQNFESDRAYGTDVFNNNRNFYTNRQDTATNDLFRLAGLGQASANATGAAGQSYANSASNLLANGAANQADYYQQRAATNAGAVNNIAGIGSNLLAGYGMSQGANTNISAISPYGYGNNVIQPANYATNIPGLRTIYG